MGREAEGGGVALRCVRSGGDPVGGRHSIVESDLDDHAIQPEPCLTISTASGKVNLFGFSHE